MKEAKLDITWTTPCTDVVGELKKQVEIMESPLVENFSRGTGYRNNKRKVERGGNEFKIGGVKR